MAIKKIVNISDKSEKTSKINTISDLMAITKSSGLTITESEEAVVVEEVKKQEVEKTKETVLFGKKLCEIEKLSFDLDTIKDFSNVVNIIEGRDFESTNINDLKLFLDAGINKALWRLDIDGQKKYIYKEDDNYFLLKLDCVNPCWVTLT